MPRIIKAPNNKRRRGKKKTQSVTTSRSGWTGDGKKETAKVSTKKGNETAARIEGRGGSSKLSPGEKKKRGRQKLNKNPGREKGQRVRRGRGGGEGFRR